MIGKCEVCGKEQVEVFEVEKLDDDKVILCCDDCWESDKEF